MQHSDPGELQFSRNPKVAEHSSRRGPASSRGSCFNSAATQRSRNTLLWTSRGPLLWPLQFSRNPKVAEHLRHQRGQAPLLVLQFSRNPKVAEHPAHRHRVRVAVVGASIQPQPKGRGTRCSSPPGRTRWRCFNSAATQRSRNTVGPVARAPAARGVASIQPQPKGRGTLPANEMLMRWFIKLQFSRNPKVAEHLHAARLAGSLAADASIQPQPKGRGTPVVQVVRRKKGLCFNSAATQRSRNTLGD